MKKARFLLMMLLIGGISAQAGLRRSERVEQKTLRRSKRLAKASFVQLELAPRRSEKKAKGDQRGKGVLGFVKGSKLAWLGFDSYVALDQGESQVRSSSGGISAQAGLRRSERVEQKTLRRSKRLAEASFVQLELAPRRSEKKAKSDQRRKGVLGFVKGSKLAWLGFDSHVALDQGEFSDHGDLGSPCREERLFFSNGRDPRSPLFLANQNNLASPSNGVSVEESIDNFFYKGSYCEGDSIVNTPLLLDHCYNSLRPPFVCSVKLLSSIFVNIPDYSPTRVNTSSDFECRAWDPDGRLATPRAIKDPQHSRSNVGTKSFLEKQGDIAPSLPSRRISHCVERGGPAF